LGIVILLLFLLLVGALLVAGFWLGGRNAGASGDGSRRRGDEPLEILRRRYAKGEITAEEYESMHEHLGL
jgi:putative membrane protein